MSHIFGLAHSFGGILDQAGSFIGGIVAPSFQTPPRGQPVPVIQGRLDGTNSPFIPDIFESFPAASTTTVDAVLDNATGACIGLKKKKRRRRRRRLASASDIRDLGSLKSILSPAEFKTWIATRSR